MCQGNLCYNDESSLDIVLVYENHPTPLVQREWGGLVYINAICIHSSGGNDRNHNKGKDGNHRSKVALAGNHMR